MSARRASLWPAGWLVLLVTMAFAWGGPALAQEKPRAEDLAEKIRRLEAQRQIPCRDVEDLMGWLIAGGTGYDLLEKGRLQAYTEAKEKLTARLAQFSLGDAKSGAPAGPLVKEFIALQERAAQAGLLAEGPVPADRRRAVRQQGWQQFFFEAEVGSAAAENKQKTRIELEEDYEKLVERWNTSRREYEQWDSTELKATREALVRQALAVSSVRQDYWKKQGQLSDLALSGKYVHCLGEITILTSRPASADDLFEFYVPGKPNTVDGLPGMGFRLGPPADYGRELAQQKIGDFPFQLHLKFNRNTYLKLEADLLEIKIKGKEEAALAIGRAAKNYAMLAFPLLGLQLKTAEWVGGEEVEKAQAKVAGFGFGVVYKVTEGFAPIGDLLIHIGTHPIDSAERVWGAAQKVPGLVEKIAADPTIRASDLKAISDGLRRVLVEKPLENLGAGGLEVLKDLASPNRFAPKEGESLLNRVNRMEAQLDSVEKVERGADTLQAVAALTLDVLTTGAQAKLGKTVTDLAKKGFFELSDLALKKEVAAASARALQAEAKIGGVKIAAELEGKLAKQAEAVDGLIAKQEKLAQEVATAVTDAPPKLLPGKAVEANGVLKVKLAGGGGVELGTGEPLGEALGSGATSKFYTSAKDSNMGVRMTALNTPEGRMAHMLDEKGREAVEKLNSANIRTVQRTATHQGTVEGLFGREVSNVYVEEVEKVPKMAKDFLKEQSGKLTAGQAVALENATRDLNKAGYAWLDNHHGNFTFEKVGPDRWRVVVVDSGGIYKMAGKTVEEQASNALKLQAKVAAEDSELKQWAKEMNINLDNPNPLLGNAVRERILEFSKAEAPIDLKTMGLKNESEVAMAGKPGVRPETGLAAKTAQELSQETDKLLADATKQLRQEFEAGQEQLKKAFGEFESAYKGLAQGIEAGKKAPAATAAEMTTAEAVKYQAAKQLTNAAVDSAMEADCARIRALIKSGVKDQDIVKQWRECEKGAVKN